MRVYNQGHVEKNGNVWRAALSWKDEEDGGKTHRMTKSTGVRCYPDKRDPETSVVVKRDNRGKKEAEAFLTSWRDELVAQEQSEKEQRSPRRPSSSDTLTEYGWKVVHRKEGVRKESTIAGYRELMSRIGRSELGDMNITGIGPEDVEGFEHDLLDQGLSPSTVRHYHVFIKMVLADAERRGLIERNPCELVEAPKVARKPINALDEEGVARLNEELSRQTDDAFVTAVLLAMGTGMREAEICALRWTDVDIDRQMIHVNHSLALEPGSTSSYELSSPKTDISRRDIPIGCGLARCLCTRRAGQAREREEFDLPWDQRIYVVGNEIDGTYLNPHVLSRRWHEFARFAGIVGTQGEYIKFHDLRHTFATVMCSSGTDVKTVSALIGHSNANMTLNVYADALASAKRKAMDANEGLLVQQQVLDRKRN